MDTEYKALKWFFENSPTGFCLEVAMELSQRLAAAEPLLYLFRSRVWVCISTAFMVVIFAIRTD